MLKDAFFFIWHDGFGVCWAIFIISIFLLCLAWIIYIIARTKALDKKLSKISWVCICIALFFMYQIVPVAFDIFAPETDLAIKTSIIPWQKGGYYIKKGQMYAMHEDFKNAVLAYDKAYSYINSYEYTCWEIVYLYYYLHKDYDKAIEMAKVWHHPMTGELKPQYSTISRCYLMKGDIDNALLYINKQLETYTDANRYKNPQELVLKAYLEKKKGHLDVAKEYYNKALNASTKNMTKEKIKDMYNDFYAYENNRLSKYGR